MAAAALRPTGGGTPFGRFAVKLNPQDPQARINLSLALLETQSKGVRTHIQVVQQVLAMAPQVADDLKGSTR